MDKIKSIVIMILLSLILVACGSSTYKENSKIIKAETVIKDAELLSTKTLETQSWYTYSFPNLEAFSTYTNALKENGLDILDDPIPRYVVEGNKSADCWKEMNYKGTRIGIVGYLENNGYFNVYVVIEKKD